jgi:diacylglycerol O-acyltransferase / trehalose O-mycolyltransferase / mycolyltransferase Ag85
MRQRPFWPVVLGLAAVVLAVTGCSSGMVTPSPTGAVAPVVTPSPSPTATPTPTTGASPTRSPVPGIGQLADDGARIVGVTMVDGRTRDLTIDSPAVGTVNVRLLIPSQFDAKPSTRWPVLYLLHGATGSFKDWTTSTDVAALTAPTGVLVVMPDAGDMGYYSDWWNAGAGGSPKWETFHLIELRQLLERNWHAGDKRAIAGLSMGGYGAIEYAERQPGMFVAAASFSGVLDTVGGHADTAVASFGGTWPTDLWGDSVAQADIWNAHNPTANAAALKGTALYVAYGTGQPGPLDASGTSANPLEQWVAPQNQTFVQKLKTLKIPVTVDAYGAGTHTWPYWQRDLHRSLPLLLKALGE